MDLSELDEFSRRYGDSLFSVHPEWRKFARQQRDDRSGTVFLVVEVPPPAGADGDLPLSIFTDNEEVTVVFDCFHTHYGWPDASFEDPLVLVHQILNEEISVASVWTGDEWRGSELIQPGALPEPEEWSPPITRVRVRSWKGTDNRDLPGDAVHSFSR